MKTTWICLVLAGIMAMPVYAQTVETPELPPTPPGVAAAIAKSIPRPVPACPMQENVNLSVNFNIHAKSFAEAKQKYEEKMKQIDDFARQQNVGKFDMQSMNYSINAQSNYDNGIPEMGYQLSGNASYVLGSSDSAFKLGEFLTQQKFQVGINVSKYKNGGMCGMSGMRE